MLTGEPIDQFSVSLNERKYDQAWVSSEFKKIDSDWAMPLSFDDILWANQACSLMVN